MLKMRFNRGDRDVLSKIYEKYKNDMLKLANSLLHDTNSAEDVLNDSFVSLAHSLGKLHLRGNLKSYLVACVLNHSRNFYRASLRKKEISIAEAMNEKTDLNYPQRTAILHEEYKRLENAMAQIPNEQREIIVLHLQSEIKFREIAKLMNISVNTAKSRYRYGLSKLHTLLDNEV